VNKRVHSDFVKGVFKHKDNSCILLVGDSSNAEESSFFIFGCFSVFDRDTGSEMKMENQRIDIYMSTKSKLKLTKLKQV